MPDATTRPTDALAAELREALGKMTPGPFRIGPPPYFEVHGADGTPIEKAWFGHDARGIVLLRNHALAILDEREALLAEVRRLREAILPLMKCTGNNGSYASCLDWNKQNKIDAPMCFGCRLTRAALASPTDAMKGG
jgi:hypothetical protein